MRIFLAALTGVALATAPITLLDGAVTLRAPTTWHLLGHEQEGPEEALYFHVRVPAMDSVSHDRVNVIIRARRLAPTASFTAYTDTVLGQVVQPGAPVLGDTLLSDHSRAVFWRGQLHGTPYVLLDKFARQDSVLVYVRSAMPLREEFAAALQQQYSHELDSLFASVSTNGVQLFPEGSGIGITHF